MQQAVCPSLHTVQRHIKQSYLAGEINHSTHVYKNTWLLLHLNSTRNNNCYELAVRRMAALDWSASKTPCGYSRSEYNKYKKIADVKTNKS